MGREISILKKKLTNLSPANPLLWMGRARSGLHIDLSRLLFELSASPDDFLNSLCSGKKKIRLGPVFNPRNPAENRAGAWLHKLSKFRQLENQERGTDHLFIAWPCIMGHWPDGSPLRTPFQFIPVHLNSDGKEWWLEASILEAMINPAFLLAYAHHCGKPLDEKLYETHLEIEAADAREYLVKLYEALKDSLLDVNFNSDLFTLKLQDFVALRKTDYPPQSGTAGMRLQPNALLGIFPLSDSVLLPDFDFLEKEDVSLEQLFCKEVPEFAEAGERDMLFPLPVDESQEACLKEILSGKNLVIQGPPGSGKSQLITNLAACAAAAGKSVLIVCQKRVALEVVLRRLEETGIASHAAMWADFRNDVSSLYASMAKQIDALEETEIRNQGLDTVMLERDFNRCCQEISRVSTSLEEWRAALFDESRAGISVLALKELLSGDEGREAPPFLLSFSRKDWEEFLLWLSRHGEEIVKGRPPGSLLAKRSIWPSGKLEIILSELKVIGRQKTDLDQFLDHHQISGERRQQAMKDLPPLAAAFSDPHEVLRELPASVVLESAFVEDMQQKAFLLEQLLELLASWPDSLAFASDELEQVVAMQQSFGKDHSELLFVKAILSGKWRTLARWHRQLRKAGFQPSIAIQGAGSLMNLGKEHSFFRGCSVFEGGLWQGRRLLAELPDLLDGIKKQAHFFNALNLSSPSAGRSSLSDIAFTAKQFLLHADRMERNRARLEELLPAFEPEDFPALAASEMDAMEAIRPAVFQSDLLLESLPAHWQEAVLYFLSSGDIFDVSAMELKWASAWKKEIEYRNPILTAPGKWFLNEIRILQEAITKKEALAKSIIRLRLEEETHRNLERNRLQNRVTYRGLYHQLTRKRQRMPLRSLWKSFGAEILRLVPCWLATPESVSATWEPDMQFDLVIFDEASQCFAEKGIPAIARGKQVVVLGDDKQLPPNHLFSTRWEEDGEPEDALFSEQDSLLDLARQFYPSRMLTGHYRSRYPELIAFSNKHFYDGKLRMLPSPETFAPRNPAIQFIKVDGQWENRSNPGEAQWIADHAISFFRDASQKTLGVICFSSSQQECIEESIYARSVETGVPVPDWFFVKNIENVQGDERDYIWFSLGYAANASGNVVSQFGSLSQQGGENRLNVAITRAKLGISIISSLHPEEWQFARRLATGPALLASYIAFAANLLLKDNEMPLPQADGFDPEGGILVFSDAPKLYGSTSMKAHFGITPLLLQRQGYQLAFRYWRK